MNFETTVYRDQFSFQRLYAKGKVLNVGSNTDGAGFAQTGGVNVDLFATDNHTGLPLPIHIFADARSLPFKRVFDSVVLGEILEHMEHDDAVKALSQARTAMKHGGRVVITMPHDHRRDEGRETEPPITPENKWYAPGIFAYHHRCISRKELFSWICEAGLNVLNYARIAYVWGEVGTGVVAC